MEDKVKDVIERTVRPALQMDGGDILFMGMEGNKVKVQLQGACNGCAAATITLQLGVLRALQEEIPEIEDVIQV
jgi:Fe-S cluster biogenesis protein NfuA